MTLEKRFTDAQPERLINEATIYRFACPAQVAVKIRQLSNLIDY